MTDHQFAVCWQEAHNYEDRDDYLTDMAMSSIWEDAEDAEIPQERLEQLRRIWEVVGMSIRDMRKATGMTQAAFAEKFLIPRRTFEDWDAGKHQPPEFVKMMLAKLLGLL